ncbi:MFS transporter [Phaeobacter inhibens]|nr:MFS transporter [Phaeobacter inhibens]UWR60928.1 MFS transporter [Phaeobacter inhibens]
MTPEPHGRLLLLLTAIFAVANMDRHILSISLDAIGQEFVLSDTQLGLLSGLVFAAMFLLAGFPIARLAAHGNKRNTVATSAAVLSFLTLMMSVSQNFMHLVLARLGVEPGEADAVAPAHAMISDRFSRETHTSALAFLRPGQMLEFCWPSLLEVSSGKYLVGGGPLFWLPFPVLSWLCS